jgi:hypothetical protein
LQRPIEREQAQKILKDHRTDLLDNFLKRKLFAAHLVMDESAKSPSISRRAMKVRRVR